MDNPLDIDSKQRDDEINKMLREQMERAEREEKARLTDRTKPCVFDMATRCMNPIKTDKLGKKFGDHKCDGKEKCDEFVALQESVYVKIERGQP